jgi:hypothetical protein
VKKASPAAISEKSEFVFPTLALDHEILMCGWTNFLMNTGPENQKAKELCCIVFHVKYQYYF